MEKTKTADCPETPSLDPRVRRTRKLIEDAFRALLAERPYGEISVADVASRATINRATFYAHFDNKEHLAIAVMGGDFDTALRARLTVGCTTAVHAVHVCCSANWHSRCTC